MIRFFQVLCSFLLLPQAFCQQLSGTLPKGSGSNTWVVLFETQGADHIRKDSTKVPSNGRFMFPSEHYDAGFYQLAVHDTDRVDIILDPREPKVTLHFDGYPLQEHVRVASSEENIRLWEYKRVSREAQAILVSTREQRRQLQVTEVLLARQLDSTELRAREMQEKHLQRIVDSAPDSYFAKVVQAGWNAEKAAPISSDAVLQAFDFGDPSLLRSAVYPKCVMFYMRSVEVTSDRSFVDAADRLVAAASADPACRAYVVGYLIDLFSQYGPDHVMQYLVDEYVVAQKVQVAPRVGELVEDLRKVAVGAVGPDVHLPVPGSDTLVLSRILQDHSYALLFFYSSTCEHCHDEMPLLKELHGKYVDRGFTVVGIALDADTSEFHGTIREEGLPWSSTSELSGWGSLAAKSYVVKATPAMFLLDRTGTIIAKPFDALELAELLGSLYP